MAVKIYLKEWRQFRELDLQQMEERSGIPATSINRIERGDQNWNSEQLGAFAEALAVEPVELLKPPSH